MSQRNETRLKIDAPGISILNQKDEPLYSLSQPAGMCGRYV
jgi:hypothetical protein